MSELTTLIKTWKESGLGLKDAERLINLLTADRISIDSSEVIKLETYSWELAQGRGAFLCDGEPLTTKQVLDRLKSLNSIYSTLMDPDVSRHETILICTALIERVCAKRLFRGREIADKLDELNKEE